MTGPINRATARACMLGVAGGVLTAASAFLPWLRVGDAGLAGVPDPAGFFVLAVGLLAAGGSVAGLVRPRDPRQLVLLAGLAAMTTLIVVGGRGPATVSDRAQARADAIAIVDGVPAPPVPEVGVAAGLFVGLAGALATTAAGLSGALGTTRGD